jgi:hypothetical protein
LWPVYNINCFLHTYFNTMIKVSKITQFLLPAQSILISFTISYSVILITYYVFLIPPSPQSPLSFPRTSHATTPHVCLCLYLLQTSYMVSSLGFMLPTYFKCVHPSFSSIRVEKFLWLSITALWSPHRSFTNNVVNLLVGK